MKATRNSGRSCPCQVWLGLVAIVLAGPPAVSAGQSDPARQVTFAKDIAPILQRSCENCHRQNGVAPMSLSTYEEVRPWVRAIKRKTSAREMPPWFIEKNVGIQKFKDDPSLSDEEIATIAKWADDGAPRGNPADMPPPRQYATAAGAGWSIGTPDLIVSSPVITVKAVAPDYNKEIGPSPTGLTEDRYIAAVEVRETRLDGNFQQRTSGRAVGDLNYFTLHHAGIRTLDFDESEGVTAGSGGNFYLIYELGQNATYYPKDTGVCAPVQVRAQALSAAGILAWLHRDVQNARQYLERSVALLRTVDNETALGRALHYLSLAIAYIGDVNTAELLTEEAVRLLRCAESPWDLATALAGLGQVKRLQGRTLEAVPPCEETTTGPSAAGVKV